MMRMLWVTMGMYGQVKNSFAGEGGHSSPPKLGGGWWGKGLP